MFLSNVNGSPKSGNMKKNCPLKCGRQHMNGSLFFCQQFRKKDLEERKAIQSKLHNVLILCLRWKNTKQQDCPVCSCPRCGAMHNILLCNSDKSLTDKTFRCESYVSDEDLTEDPEALVNEDKCFLTKRSKLPAEKKSPDKQMEEVKAILKTLSLEQKMEDKTKI